MSALHRAIQRIHTIADAPRLTRFYLNPPKTVEVEFANGSKFNLSAEFLRVYSPAADGKIRSVGGEKVIIMTVFFFFLMSTIPECCFLFGAISFHIALTFLLLLSFLRYTDSFLNDQLK
ncbi:hypothetical protein SLEP1_g48846 [Rubroshorea leprosula]|uniref:Gamma-butyrobetaine hydroxylase-like N-terminal domain-containing protein n=1 Tax=Rubroshorea leprosula TaxID=152421 RepID=A0AAV5LVU3_9ROSI|nr:hypothetical protein SLEP1_g48846 [Rubroshorea leprosula]